LAAAASAFSVVRLIHRTDAGERAVTGRYVVGADRGRSFVRSAVESS